MECLLTLHIISKNTEDMHVNATGSSSDATKHKPKLTSKSFSKLSSKWRKDLEGAMAVLDVFMEIEVEEIV